MPRHKGWSESELARIRHYRQTLKMTWKAIDEAFGRGAGTCYWAYNYYGSKTKVSLQRKVQRALKDHPPEKQSAVAERISEPAKRPRYFHIPDTDLVGRIERQGLNAGFFGDPPPGRSALDQKHGAS